MRGSAIGSCPRQISALLHGLVPRSFDAAALRIFETGTDRGKALARAIEQAYSKDHRVSLEHPALIPTSIEGDAASAVFNKATDAFGIGNNTMLGMLPLELSADDTPVLLIRAHCDVVLFDLDTTLVDLIEIKTKNQWGFKKLDEEGIDASYAMQVMGQVHGLETAGYTVRNVTVLYENKNDCDLKPMPFNHEDASLVTAYGRQLRRIEAALLGWASGAPMDSVPAVHVTPVLKEGSGPLPWQCNYCSVGPIAGRCVDPARLNNKKPNDRIPKWEVIL